MMERTLGRELPPADDVVGTGELGTIGRPGLLRRLWNTRIALHLVALAIVLLALVPVVGTASSFSSDGGAGIIQARSLAAGDGWIVPPPMPQVDPDGEW